MDMHTDETGSSPSPNAERGVGPGRRAVLKVLAILGLAAPSCRPVGALGAAPRLGPQAEPEVPDDPGPPEAHAAVRPDPGVPPALTFLPVPPGPPVRVRRKPARSGGRRAPRRRPDDEDMAFLPVTELAALIRSGRVSSMSLTELYLGRLKRFDPLLKCVVTLTERVAREQARKADAELAAGLYRGPLHGIPWGAKDMIAYPGYPTTWGAEPLRKQFLREKATVASRLEQAGAVLVAKLSVGAFSTGDHWFGGQTRNPWNPDEGSSGSSAGSAAATAAGLVGFALGCETNGSIVSPCRRCGASGLRPTFGRVSRHGCLPLAWSMDKIGPIARSLADCALVLEAIHGADGLDPAAVDRPFHWRPGRSVRGLRVGYLDDDEGPPTGRKDLEVLRGLGVVLVPVRLPTANAEDVAAVTISAEAAAVFDGFTRSRGAEGESVYPVPQPVSAVDYLRAARVRTVLLRELAELMRSVDLYVCNDTRDVTVTNLTGYPTVVLPFGHHGGGPGAVCFTGRPYGEATLLALAHAFQQAIDDHQRRPPLGR